MACSSSPNEIPSFVNKTARSVSGCGCEQAGIEVPDHSLAGVPPKFYIT